MRDGRIALVAALIGGVAGDTLLRAGPWGAGFSLWVVLVVGAAIVTTWSGGRRIAPSAMGFLAAAVLFGACLSLRDSSALRIWNVAGALIAMVMALLAGRGLTLGSASVIQYVHSVVVGAHSAISAPIRAATNGTGRLTDRSARLAVRVLLAVLLSIPLLLLFGTLLTAADPVFGHLVRTAFAIDIGRLISHVVVITILSWSTGGYVLALLHRSSSPLDGTPAWLPTLGLIEIGIPMTALAFLFVAFIGVQAGYLFGGEALVQATVGLSFAEYARRGFFELVAASGLAIPVVIAADLLLRQDDPRTVRWFRWIARLQILCVGLIMGSALERLRIYYQAYGLTVDRLLAGAVMLWIGFTLGWFAFTVLRGRRMRFPLVTVFAGLVVLATVDAINPEAVVVHVNVQRAIAGAELDVQYLSRLSGDAVPTLTTHVDRLPSAVRDTLMTALAERWRGLGKRDWRSWNLGYAQASEALTGALGDPPR
jgi:hypothetical protein